MPPTTSPFSLLGWALTFTTGFDGIDISTALLGAGGGLLWPGTFFLMEALRSPIFAQNSAVAYSLHSIATVALLFAAGAIFWRERVTRLNVVGVAVVIAAIVLLNLG